MTEAFVTAEQVAEAVSYIRNCTSHQPVIGIELGSGLGSLADILESADVISPVDVPHWPVSTVLGHAGRLVIGLLEGKPAFALQGRVHYYEGYSMGRITFPVRVMHALGVKTMILTNAAGGLNPDYNVGDLMLIRDHLNIPGMAGHNPLRGPNDEAIGPRFPDMTEPYSAALRALAKEVAQEAGFSVQEGVYAYVAGPSFETPAELRFLRMSGGDAVGMSTAPSTVVARHAGMNVLGISTITNMALPDPRPGTAHSHEEVLAMGQQATPRLIALVRGVVRRLE